MERKTIEVVAEPTRDQVLDFARSALRNAPWGTVTPGLIEALEDDLKSGLLALSVERSS